MKVALLGNMNNMFFAAARHLRHAGVDVHLFLFNDTPPHFHPGQDSFSLDYQSYTTTLPYGSWQSFHRSRPEALAEDTRGYDFLIGTGTAPALAHRAGKKLDVFFPYGEDIVYLPFWAGLPTRASGLLNPLTLRHHQRMGIRETPIYMGVRSPRDDALYAKLGKLQGTRVVALIPTLCSLEFAPEKLPTYYAQSTYYEPFKRLRDEADLLVFSHNRVAIEKTVNYKGTEKLLEGLASFVKRHPELRTRLALIEYGPDVARARRLVESLGIVENVRWFPLMPRKETLLGLSMADIACGEFGYSWLVGGTISECIAMGKPMLHYREDSDFLPSELFPVLPSKTADDISAQLERWVTDREAVIEIGRQGKIYYDQSLVDVGVQTLLGLIEEKKTYGNVKARSVDPALKAILPARGSAVPAAGDAISTALAHYKNRLRALFHERK
jgi:glycosyltransferase involved in cell wall biosynthesis